MPNILFASNNISHWPMSVSSTLAGTFDPTRVPYSLKVGWLENFATPDFPESASTVTWIHFRNWFNSFEENEVPDLLRIFDASNNLLVRLFKYEVYGEFDLGLMLYNDGTGSGVKAGFALNKATMNSIDVKITITAGTLDADLYINGGLAGTKSFAANDGNYTNPTHFAIGSAFCNDSGSDFTYFSEFIVADGDTRNARMSLLRPTASGGETDWVGVATELADNDPTSGMTSIAANERETLDFTAYTGASNISSVVIATQSVAGVNAPQNIRHTVRLSTVNYDSAADIPVGITLQYDQTDFQLNPATSLPWVAGDLTGMEFGFISKA